MNDEEMRAFAEGAIQSVREGEHPDWIACVSLPASDLLALLDRAERSA
jgi:hypothetical protein